MNFYDIIRNFVLFGVFLIVLFIFTQEEIKTNEQLAEIQKLPLCNYNEKGFIPSDPYGIYLDQKKNCIILGSEVI